MGKAVDYLVASCNADGSFGEGLLDQAICTTALAEFYQMMANGERAESARAAAERGLKYIVSQQGKNGMFGDGDVYVTLWQARTFSCSRIAVSEFPHRSYEELRTALTVMLKGDGGTPPHVDAAGRRQGQPTIRLTAMFLAMRQLLGTERAAPDCVAQSDWLTRDDAHLRIARAAADFETIYFLGSAFHQIGGQRWREWWREVVPALEARQVKSGKFRGSWPGATEPDRIRNTAFACLELEVRFPLTVAIEHAL